MSKYVKFGTTDGNEFCIVFPDTLVHAEIAEAIQRVYCAEVLTAGFVDVWDDENGRRISDDQIKPHGRSESLNVDSNPAKDRFALAQCLNRNY